jgi:hypothetical protein
MLPSELDSPPSWYSQTNSDLELEMTLPIYKILTPMTASYNRQQKSDRLLPFARHVYIDQLMIHYVPNYISHIIRHLIFHQPRHHRKTSEPDTLRSIRPRF